MRILIFLLIAFSLYAISLKEVLGIVERENLALESKKLDTQIAEESSNERKAKRFGTLGFKGGVTKYNTPRTLAPLAPPISPNTVTSETIESAALMYSVVLFDGNGERSEIELTDIKKTMTEVVRQNFKDLLLYNTKSIYLKALSLNKKTESKKHYIDSLKKLFKESQERLLLGNGSELDLLKVNSELTKEETELQNLHYGVQALKYELANLMGRDEIDFTLEERDIKVKEIDLNLGDIDTLAEYRLANFEVEKKEKELKKAQSTLYPTITFESSYIHTEGGGASEENHQNGIYLTYPLFDFGARGSKIESSKLSLLKAKTDLKNVELTIQKKLEIAKLEIAKNKETLKSADTELALAEKIEAIEKVKLDEGRGRIQDYLYYLALRESAYAKKLTANFAVIDAIYYLEFLKENR